MREPAVGKDDGQCATESPGLAAICVSEGTEPSDRSFMKQPQPTASCWAFGTEDGRDANATKHNAEVARIINVLGASGSGRRAILTAVAGRQGITDENDIVEMLKGTSKLRLEAPPGLREALQDIGLGCALMPVNTITLAEQDAILTNTDAEWEDLEFEVALDSGSVVHVCSLEDCPGYKLAESPGSRRKQEFLMGDGGTIANLGEKALNLSSGEADLQSVFQIAAVTRPLMSVGKICDEGHDVRFNNVMAVVTNKDGVELCRFHRNNGGLYVAKLKLRNPAGFGGLE